MSNQEREKFILACVGRLCNQIPSLQNNEESQVAVAMELSRCFVRGMFAGVTSSLDAMKEGLMGTCFSMEKLTEELKTESEKT